jgi:hypothetical protein
LTRRGRPWPRFCSNHCQGSWFGKTYGFGSRH